MARICSTFKLTAIYLEQRGKVLSRKAATGREEGCSCYLKKSILPHSLLGKFKWNTASLGVCTAWGHVGDGVVARVTVELLTFIGEQEKCPLSLLGKKCLLGKIKE